MENNNQRIKVIDSPVGTGKTSWAIEYCNNLPEDQKIIYITPFLSECERMQNGCPNKKFIQPDFRLGLGRKRTHFLSLIRKEENIVSTHSLFSMIDDEIIMALRGTNYILILDEAFQVLDQFDMWEELYQNTNKADLTQSNMKSLINKNFVQVDNDYKVNWIDTENPIDKYASLKRLSDRGLIYLINDSLLLWTFPYEIFMHGIFSEVFILTYLFDYQLQKYYYDYFKIQYGKYHIEKINDKYTMIETTDHEYEKDWKRNASKLIDVLDNYKLNKIGDYFYDKSNRRYDTALSRTWYINNEKEIPQIRNNIINYFTHITSSKSDERMWTCFEPDKKKFKDKNLLTNEKKYWVALNSRSTNNFGHKSILAYPLNRFMNPYYDDFFNVKNIIIDQEGFAISEFVQWLWRSALRNNKPIQLYLPSIRMRNLLDKFLTS